MNKILSQIDTFVFTGGANPKKDILKYYLKTPKLVVCGDSGYKTATKMGYTPNFIVGDFDSLNIKDIVHFPKENIVKHSPIKNFTDTELALKLAYSKGAKNIALIGGGAGRADHFLAILNLFYSTLYPTVWFTKNEIIAPFKGNIEITKKKGKSVSFAPLTLPLKTNSKGLYWELQNVTWQKHFMSLSNEIVSTKAQITVQKGKMLLFYNL